VPRQHLKLYHACEEFYQHGPTKRKTGINSEACKKLNQVKYEYWWCNSFTANINTIRETKKKGTGLQTSAEESKITFTQKV
jgi:hypothetical protein